MKLASDTNLPSFPQGEALDFKTLLPRGLKVDFLVDRKADDLGNYEVQNHTDTTLAEALKSETRCFVISSFAFKQEIAKNISHHAHCLGIKQVEILSLQYLCR